MQAVVIVAPVFVVGLGLVMHSDKVDSAAQALCGQPGVQCLYAVYPGLQVYAALRGFTYIFSNLNHAVVWAGPESLDGIAIVPWLVVIWCL